MLSRLRSRDPNDHFLLAMAGARTAPGRAQRPIDWTESFLFDEIRSFERMLDLPDQVAKRGCVEGSALYCQSQGNGRQAEHW